MLIKDLQPFQQWSNMKNIDNRAKISENSDEIFRSLVKSLKIKFLHRMKRSVRMLSFKIRNLTGLEISNHEDFSSRQHSEALTRRCFMKKSPLIISKNSQENTCVRVFFNKVASLTLLKIDSSTRAFLQILQHFEGHLLCKTHTCGGFWAFLKPQNKWYNIVKIGIYMVNLHLPWRK